MDFSTKIIIPKTVYSQKVDGELVLLDMASEQYFGLDAVGTDIWRLFEEGKTIGQTLEEMQKMYEVEPDQLRRDLTALLDNLLSSGLVKLS